MSPSWPHTPSRYTARICAPLWPRYHTLQQRRSTSTSPTGTYGATLETPHPLLLHPTSKRKGEGKREWGSVGSIVRIMDNKSISEQQTYVKIIWYDAGRFDPKLLLCTYVVWNDVAVHLECSHSMSLYRVKNDGFIVVVDGHIWSSTIVADCSLVALGS